MHFNESPMGRPSKPHSDVVPFLDVAVNIERDLKWSHLGDFGSRSIR